jgi:8-oxo-dGTP diphosphatase
MTKAMTTIVVTAAIVERDDGFLVTRRQKGTHLEGYWEFPGGKCDAGESLAACLTRELREELDVDARVGDEVFTTTHTYPDRVRRSVRRCAGCGRTSSRRWRFHRPTRN